MLQTECVIGIFPRESTFRMLWALAVAALFLAATSSARSPPCRYSTYPPAGLKVDCSFSNLTELTVLPPDTTELFVQDNRLTLVTPGLFDKLVGLEKVSLSGNPFHCDCSIQYLRNWLLKNRAVVSQQPTCASPGSVAHREISILSNDDFTSCAKANSTCGTFNIVLSVAIFFLIALLSWSLGLAKMSTITLYIDRKHTELDPVALRPLRPRRRRRVNSQLSEDSHNSGSLLYVEDLDKAILNMDLLPQVLDTLHRRHNIKVTVPEKLWYAA